TEVAVFGPRLTYTICVPEACLLIGPGTVTKHCRIVIGFGPAADAGAANWGDARNAMTSAIGLTAPQAVKGKRAALRTRRHTVRSYRKSFLKFGAGAALAATAIRYPADAAEFTYRY